MYQHVQALSRPEWLKALSIQSGRRNQNSVWTHKEFCQTCTAFELLVSQSEIIKQIIIFEKEKCFFNHLSKRRFYVRAVFSYIHQCLWQMWSNFDIKSPILNTKSKRVNFKDIHFPRGRKCQFTIFLKHIIILAFDYISCCYCLAWRLL